MMQPMSVVVIAGLVCLSEIGLSSSTTTKSCDLSQCKGPLRFYEEINCEPVKNQPEDCCPFRYNCPHLSAERAQNKCYVNNNVYSPGEDVKPEDRAFICDECKCIQRDDSEFAHFECAMNSDFWDFKRLQPKEGCYFRENFTVCSPGQEICPEKPEDRPKCEVDGKTYLDGEEFSPADRPDLVCHCAEGYKGENVAPFCRRNKCGLDLHHYVSLKENCAPVYHSNQPLQTSCFPYGSFRCHNSKDVILAPEGPASHPPKVPDEQKCKFGNLTLFIGERLNMATDYNSVCVKCTCEVPPVPTCVRLPDDMCDVTKHPPFTY